MLAGGGVAPVLQGFSKSLLESLNEDMFEAIQFFRSVGVYVPTFSTGQLETLGALLAALTTITCVLLTGLAFLTGSSYTGKFFSGAGAFLGVHAGSLMIGLPAGYAFTSVRSAIVLGVYSILVSLFVIVGSAVALFGLRLWIRL